MSKDRDDERNTGMPGEETFSLEEILADRILDQILVRRGEN